MTVPATVYLFANPKSYTGEDLIEFHIPGNPLLARILLDALIGAGARHAEPGEFTARAYFNGRMDLSEAEGVAAVVAAHSENELRAARQLMAGELARRLRPAMDALTDSLALLEAGIDFSDEDINFISRDELIARISRIDADLDELARSSESFERLTHEPTFVLIGRPNAGKSTLLNALAGHERAIVSPVAGTTRDVLSAHVRLKRGVVRVLDVAGLDESAPQGAPIERLMDQHARRAIEAADRVILVQSLTDTAPPLAALPYPDIVVMTKSDLKPTRAMGKACIVSALTGEGTDELRSRMDETAFAALTGGTLALNARHLQHISHARQALRRARDIAPSAGHELVALELREALDALGGVLGQVAPDEVLGKIFSAFCIGK
jgi:tRNA modification GTPase